MSHIQSLTILRALIGRIPNDTSISEKLVFLMNRIEREASGVIEVMNNPDPERSALAIDRIINAEKASLRAEIGNARREAYPLIASWRAQQDAARIQKANLVPDAFAAEIRSVFRTMSWPAKLQFMTDATSLLDGATVAAVLNAPPVLAGVTPEQLAQFREAYLNKTSKSSEQVAASMQSAVDTFFTAADDLARPDGAAPRPTGGNPLGVNMQH